LNPVKNGVIEARHLRALRWGSKAAVPKGISIFLNGVPLRKIGHVARRGRAKTPSGVLCVTEPHRSPRF
jgi:hypothetical protein